MNRPSFPQLATYFFRGLLVTVPFALTCYIIYQTLEWMDSLIPMKIPGLGLLIILAVVTLLGYLASFFITRSLFEHMEKYLIRIPLVNIIYTSIKDLIKAFVGDGQKFNKPVVVSLNPAETLLKIGFVTREDLEHLSLPGYVSVYMPHSYNFSGNHFLVARNQVKPLDVKGADAMKFVVSGGVSDLTLIDRSSTPVTGKPPAAR